MKIRTILVDDEPLSVYGFRLECEKSSVISLEGTFEDPSAALEYARLHRVDFALLDIELPGMKGTQLGARLRELYPDIILMYVTAYDEYALESIKQRADMYILKPYLLSDVEEALNRARLLSKRLQKRIFIRTFGNFDMFIDGKTAFFSSLKAKEMLAILVDRNGGVVTSREMFAYIYEDKEYTENSMSLIRKIAFMLRGELKDFGAECLLLENNGDRCLDTSVFDCDLYMYLGGDRSPECLFAGEYMSQYSWAEPTLARLERLKAGN